LANTQPKQQRRIVFFIGAGASLGAGASAPIQGGGEVAIPTQATFWETFLRFCHSKANRRKIESFLFRYFLGYGKAPGRATAITRRKLLQPIDVEEVFTFLSERNNAPGVASQFQAYTKEVWDALLQEIGIVFGKFFPNAKTRTTYKTFLRNHVRTRDTVVSFNYDWIFERSLPSTRKWYYGGIDPDHRPQALRILKPHGSINWQEIEGNVEVHRSAVSENPLIIAPTHLKFIGTNSASDGGNEIVGYLNQSRKISEVWTLMEKEMREAKAWAFIGYSFPPSDLYFSSVMRSTLAVRSDQPLVIIVNPDSMAISQRLRSRFSIPPSRIKTYSDLQTFNQITRKQLLN
jgi:hypothetical protein